MTSRLLSNSLWSIPRTRPCIPTLPRAHLATAARLSPRRPVARAALLSGALLGGGTLALLGLSAISSPIHADSDVEDGALPSQRPPPPLRELVRTYIVYSLCSIPGLVDYAPSILSALLSVPGLGALTEAAVRATFFAQVRSAPFLLAELR